MFQSQPFQSRAVKKGGRGKPPSQQTVYKSMNFAQQQHQQQNAGKGNQTLQTGPSNFAQTVLSNIAAANNSAGYQQYGVIGLQSLQFGGGAGGQIDLLMQGGSGLNFGQNQRIAQQQQQAAPVQILSAFSPQAVQGQNFFSPLVSPKPHQQAAAGQQVMAPQIGGAMARNPHHAGVAVANQGAQGRNALSPQPLSIAGGQQYNGNGATRPTNFYGQPAAGQRLQQLANVHKSADASGTKVGLIGVDPGIYDGKILANGYQISLACGPLKKARYVNMAIEKELAEFKEEISDKFENSDMNKTYVFPRSEDLERKSQANESLVSKRNQKLVLAMSLAKNDSNEEARNDSGANYGALKRQQSNERAVDYKQSKGTIKQLMQINISSEQQLLKDMKHHRGD